MVEFKIGDLVRFTDEEGHIAIWNAKPPTEGENKWRSVVGDMYVSNVNDNLYLVIGIDVDDDPVFLYEGRPVTTYEYLLKGPKEEDRNDSSSEA